MKHEQKKYWITAELNSTTAEMLLYGYISEYDISAGDFVRDLNALAEKYANINLRINSYGGSVFEGLGIYNAIKRCSANVETFVDGIAASMASIVAIAGKKVHMSKSARIMTHKPSGGSFGTADEMKQQVQLLESLENTMASIYSIKTGKTAEECKLAFMNGQDTWFDADQAMAENLVDDVYEDGAVQAPDAKADIKMAYDSYAHQFAARYNATNPDNNMEIINLSAASLAALGITAKSVDAATIDAAIAGLKTKADGYDAMKAEKEQAVNELDAFKKTQNGDKVKAILDKALADKKMTKAASEKLAADYAENPDGLKALVDAMHPYQPITGQIKQEGPTDRLAELMAMTWEQLDKGGLREELRTLSASDYAEKYKEKFGVYPSGYAAK